MAEAQSNNSDFSDDEEVNRLDETFNKAAQFVRKITSKLSNFELLELYGLYKQSTEGPCNTPKPGWLDGKGRKKWEAWNTLCDMPSEEAKQIYIDLVQKHDPNGVILSPSGPKESWAAVSSLQHDVEPDLVDKDMSLLDAARENMAALVTEMLTKNPSLKDERDEEGLSALHWAADRDSVSALLAAIKGGCDVNAVDNSGQTPLHYAASCGHVKSTHILIDCGATIRKDNDDCTPLDVVSDEMVRKILRSAD